MRPLKRPLANTDDEIIAKRTYVNKWKSSFIPVFKLERFDLHCCPNSINQYLLDLEFHLDYLFFIVFPLCKIYYAFGSRFDYYGSLIILA